MRVLEKFRLQGVEMFLVLFALGVGVSAQTSAPATSPAPDSSTAKPAQRTPNLQAPRSDRVNVNDLGPSDGVSSSKDPRIDLSPPPDDDKAHPKSGEMLEDESAPDGSGMHAWDPHKSAKDVEVGDFYFRRKNYRAAEDRYREALFYKDNDALATFRLAVCLEKLDRPDEAKDQYQNYLNILPHGAQAEEAKSAVDRLSKAASAAKK